MSVLFKDDAPKPCKHGSIGGYVCHRRRDEDACATCKRAWRMYYSKQRGTRPKALKGVRNPDRRKSG